MVMALWYNFIMTDNNATEPIRLIDEPALPTTTSEEIKRQRRIVILLIIIIIIVLLIFIASLAFLLNPETSSVTVARIRDVFIIIMAVESIFVGVVLVVLMVQLARLMNLMQNEIRPILDSTNETINNLRGTTEFLTTNLAEPVIKINEYVAALQKITELLHLTRK
jgi:hypothetical protein